MSEHFKNRISLNLEIIDEFIINNKLKIYEFCKLCGISRSTFNTIAKNGHITSRGTLYNYLLQWKYCRQKLLKQIRNIFYCINNIIIQKYVY